MTARRRRQTATAYLFLLPSFAGFLLFVVGPVLASLVLSFMDWNLINPPTFTGLTNYNVLRSIPVGGGVKGNVQTGPFNRNIIDIVLAGDNAVVIGLAAA